MAQITEKRVITAQGRMHNSNHSHAHGNSNHNGTLMRTKENSNVNGNNNNNNIKTQVGGRKGVEILDFHESWLEEVELYKDKLIECKQYPHHQHHHQQQQQQQQQPSQHTHLLGTHNHSHTSSHGCHIEGTPRPRNSARNAAGGNAGSGRNDNGNVKNPQNAPHETTKTVYVQSKRRLEKQTAGSTGTPKQRVVVRSVPKATANGNAVTSLQNTEPYKKVQMLLKRAREDAVVKHASNSKKPNTAANHHGQSPVKTGGGSGVVGSSVGHATAALASGKHTNALAGGSSNMANGALSSASAKSASSKIVVNTFHASNQLNAQQLETDKTNFLTQNGITKSAAMALETSLYASMYTAHPAQVPPHFNGVRLQTGESGGFMGVTLHKAVLDAERQRHMANQNSSNQAEDDPCAAIDDVNNYDDSDSEEDYIGSPFYLEEDGTETHQSRNIRLQLTEDDDRYSHMSVGTNDTEASVYFKPAAILSPSLFPNVPPYLNFTSHADKGPPMPPTLHRVLKWKLSPVMPKIVKRVVLNSGFRIIKNTTDWMAVWEKHMKSPGFRTIRSHQKYNHIPGSFRIGRKDTMWRSIHNNMKKFGKKEFGFMQKSYIMPDDLENLRQVWPKNASKLAKWIVKPPASARGTGIRIVNKWSQFPKDRPLVVQKYIERPLLINDNKFDMRLYVVLTSINPLRIYIYKDGLARFASVKYSSELSNLDERCMHLTNYSINKFSQNYAKNEDFNACQGHKWTLQSLWSCLENRGVNTKRLWATLRNLVIKAIVSGESGLNRMYRQNVNFRYNCFELFGFDVLLDENLVPWLLEINISPSLHSELPLDLHVKGPLIQAVLNTALYQVPPKLTEKQQRDILDELSLQGPLCHDKRIFTTCLTAEEVRKHNQYTNRNIEFREEYVDTILDNLLPDDVRCLIVSEDEFARCKPLERIFPTADTHTYLRFVENPRYYNRLLDAWEQKYSQDRSTGIALIKKLCQEGYHLQVSDAALEKEPNVTLTEIDMLHVKKEDQLDSVTNTSTVINSIVIGDTGTSATSQDNTSKWNNDLKPGAKEGSIDSHIRPA